MRLAFPLKLPHDLATQLLNAHDSAYAPPPGAEGSEHSSEELSPQLRGSYALAAKQPPRCPMQARDCHR